VGDGFHGFVRCGDEERKYMGFRQIAKRREAKRLTQRARRRERKRTNGQFSLSGVIEAVMLPRSLCSTGGTREDASEGKNRPLRSG
jgi:hypothetical protein